MKKKNLSIRLDKHGRVTVGDAELEAMIAAEEIPLAGGDGINDFCNNGPGKDCSGTINVSCANYPGTCDNSSNAGLCGRETIYFDPH